MRGTTSVASRWSSSEQSLRGTDLGALLVEPEDADEGFDDLRVVAVEDGLERGRALVRVTRVEL